ncbi:hypothetical protein WU86_03400 [Corynebacterium xerosis]|nr:hypothetical protein WU86_03400 [Corynebacterium xerosis]
MPANSPDLRRRAVRGLRPGATGRVGRHGRRDAGGVADPETGGQSRHEAAHVRVAAAGGVDDIDGQRLDEGRGDGTFAGLLRTGLHHDRSRTAEGDHGGADVVLGGQRRRRVRPVAGFGAFLHRGRSHEDGELVLVDDEHVDQLQQVRRHVAHRRQVEHHGHPGVSGDARGLDDGVVGDLQAQAQHPGGPDGIAPVADEARVDGAVGAGGNDDAVLRLIVDQDHRRAGGLRRLGQVGHVHAASTRESRSSAPLGSAPTAPRNVAATPSRPTVAA